MVALRRAAQVLLWAVVVGLFWRWVSHTAWASLLDVTSAGEQFVDPIEALRMVTGALLIAVPAVLLIRSMWSWLERSVLDRQHTDRIGGGARSTSRS